jgi:hypothetical protein
VLKPFWRKMFRDFFLRGQKQWHSTRTVPLATRLKERFHFWMTVKLSLLPRGVDTKITWCCTDRLWYMGCSKTWAAEAQINTLVDLKRALKDVWRKLDLETVNKTLNTWPKHCRKIYNYHGTHIEHLLQ